MTAHRYLQKAAVLLALTAAMTATAQQDRDNNRDRPQDKDRQKQQDKQAQQQQNLQRLSQIIGTNVQTQDGKNCGKIQNVALDLQNGRTVYCIINAKDAASGLDKNLIPVPFKALKFSDQQQSKLNVDLQRLKEAPEFEASGWNTIGNPEWGEKVHTHYRVRMDASNDQNSDRQQPLALVKATEVMDLNVGTPKREDIGQIEDFLIDTDRGRIALAVMKIEKGRAAQSDRLYAVPWQSVDFNKSDRIIVLKVQPDRLREAPAFEPNNWPNFADGKFTQRVYTFYNVQPDEVYGYTPPRGDDDDQRWGGGGNTGGWLPRSEYGQLFDRNSIQTIHGRITAIRAFTPKDEMPEGVMLKVEADNNQTYDVHLGPKWFIERQQMQFRDGDRVRIVGSRIDFEGKTAIMASEVWRDDHVLMLRNKNGLPAWDAFRNAQQVSGDSMIDDRDRDRDRNRGQDDD